MRAPSACRSWFRRWASATTGCESAPSRRRLPPRRPPGTGPDQGTGVAPSFILTQFGVTTGQSLGEYLVVASTAKLVRADQFRGDLDLGAMMKVGSVRLGISAKNMVAPDLTVDGIPVEHNRQVRVGAAFVPAARGGVSLIAAVDADLTTTATAAGEVRHVAGGAEVQAGRLGLRGGVSVNTIAEAAAVLQCRRQHRCPERDVRRRTRDSGR